MECNRDEALRAKTIAEKKLVDKDFAGAKKFTIKAQTLYPELDGISQMFAILDVYISAENKVSGEMDWYGILGANPSDDDETIRKQYRKLALVLHPDKNKYVGADGAFNLLSEAWSLLSDKAKRRAYNQRRSLRGFQQKVPLADPPAVFRQADTFWTICFRCKMHYEYLNVYLNHTLLCSNCHKPFLAKRTAAPVKLSKPPHSSMHQQHHDSSNHARINPGGAPSGLHSSNNTSGFWSPFSGADARCNTDASIASKAAKVVQRATIASKAGNVVQQASIASKAASVIQRVNERLRREREESYTGRPPKNMKVDSGEQSSFGIPYQMPMRSNKLNSTRELTPLETRNMLMQKAQKEICRKIREWLLESEVEEKKADHIPFTGTPANTVDMQEHQEPAMNVPDPDFHNFDLDRTETSFQDNEVWAAYDDEDGMPRFYALVHKVLSRKPLKIKISWLNSKTTLEFGQTDWIGSGFRKTCGEFRIGRHELYNSLNSFSQKIQWKKTPRGSVLIYPRKGEVWALYRNWSSDWSEHTPDHVIHQYEMVEVLDDYNEERGVPVSPLAKVIGLTTVFRPQTDQSEVKTIVKDEMFRFSHQVPKYLLTGEEAHNSPKGCLELDPAATSLELIRTTS